MKLAWSTAGLCAFACLAMAPSTNAATKASYSYDALGRLAAVCNSTSATANMDSYKFDGAGSRQNYESKKTVLSLSSGDQILSPDNRFFLMMQTDGNLVEYGPDGPLWASNTVGSGAVLASFQSDGNFVLYTSSGMPVWTTSTWGNDCASLALQDDGNLVIYRSDGLPLWSNNGGNLPPAILAIGNASATEGGTLSFTVTRSGNTNIAASASWATGNGTAEAGSDYIAASGTVNLAAGEVNKTIGIATVDDGAVEAAETLTVTLSSPSPGTTIGAATGTGTISDNDVMVIIHRFLKGSRHLMTMSYSEGINAGWTYEGIAFRLFPAGGAGYAPLYRCLNASTGDRFISFQSNCEGKSVEGLLGYSSSGPSGNLVPLYRYYKASAGDHFITINTAEVQSGYVSEDILGYVAS